MAFVPENASASLELSAAEGSFAQAPAPAPAPERRRTSPGAAWQTVTRNGFVVHVDPTRQSPLAFALSVAAGLDGRPRRLDASFLYDAAGSLLFEQITAEPEYYLTRIEDRMLAESAPLLRRLAGSGPLIELGSGASTKTARLLDAWCAAGPSTYVPVDVDAGALEGACAGLHRRYPGLVIEGLAATYEHALAALRGWTPGRTRGGAARTVVFLGSSLGNLGWREYPELCQSVARALEPGDAFLVGLDLVKDPSALEAAYNDGAGITARFTRNLFSRMNRELGTAIPDDAFGHVAFYDAERERIEIFAEARREVIIHVEALRRSFRVPRGDRILTETSRKFRAPAAIATIARCGFRPVWHDVGDGQFGLFLFARAEEQARRAERARGGPADPGGARLELGLLSEMRTRTLDLVAPLSDGQLMRQHSPLMSPIAWDLGHIACFEALWLLPADRRDGAEPVPGSSSDSESQPAPALDDKALLDDRLYDPLATPRARRAELPLPSVAAVRARMRDVRARVEDQAASTRTLSGPASPPGPSIAPAGLDARIARHLVLQHEAQHQEIILQAIALREDIDYRPTFSELEPGAELPPAGGLVPVDHEILVPAGTFVMGTHDRLWAYDNERPAHEVDVPAFRLDRSPVTNARFHAFMRDGGYARRSLWSEAGWSWVQQTHARAPLHWRRPPGEPGGPGQARAASSSIRGADEDFPGGWEAVVFGSRVPLHPDAPVVHVSWFEADACARWMEARLPTEAEWEKAAAWDPARGVSRPYPWGDRAWERRLANLDQHRLEPGVTGAYPDGRSTYGCLQMLGDVWEWTSTWFGGYPGFESFPYREYSEIFFGSAYRVLRGGSFATRAAVARTTFRNWDLPERRQIFAGFRCARPA
jgi:gamma-glutamyl hercynylcysteine S-oxide synthase